MAIEKNVQKQPKQNKHLSNSTCLNPHPDNKDNDDLSGNDSPTVTLPGTSTRMIIKLIFLLLNNNQ